MKTAFMYSDAFSKYDLGPEHPLKVIRLKMTHDLIQACGLLVPHDPRIIDAPAASIEDLLTFHTPDYITALERANSGLPFPGAGHFGLGPGDNPIFPGLLDASRLIAGASLKAAALIESNEADIVFNISGGLHHAMPSSSSGFCYINDPVLAILSLIKKDRRVAYIDIDAHHGDGVQAAFYGTDQVLTVSLHETGAQLFPGTGFEHETGTGQGKGYSINLPLPPQADDELFLHAFEETVPPLIEAFRPDIVVSQLGVDSFRRDPLADLNYTTNGFCEAVRQIRSFAPRWLALGGGGYKIANVARAWTLAWAIMSDQELPEIIPEPFREKYAGALFQDGKMQDKKYIVDGKEKELMRREVDRVINYIRENVIGKMKR